MGLKIADLLGKVVKARIIDVQQKSKSLIIDLEHEKNKYKLGIYSPELAEGIFDKHGESNKKGDNFLTIPQSFLIESEEEKVGKWVNVMY